MEGASEKFEKLIAGLSSAWIYLCRPKTSKNLQYILYCDRDEKQGKLVTTFIDTVCMCPVR
jgi:hypothetical protein